MIRKVIPTVQIILKAQRPLSSIRLSSSSIYEPDYLDSLKPKYPQFESLNVQIKGYDYPILESYQSFLHSVAEYLDIDVLDCYALPPQQTQVQRLRPNSAVVEAEYKLTTYERSLQLNNVEAPVYPQFLRIAEAALPEGVKLTVQQHTDDCEERRYVPDRDLLDLKAELERMQGGVVKKK
ncbi:39S ribosomal protein L48, mitochondrial [Scaptodrosophila lebanonensis]|uniref:39S ribosomal protein L48, mitochondrial n=1 Tax=Drosophila lebanonensis TaxID=7225 RepID=A0A6J2UBP0_DROLE|nr:39S ribosomal protein L48, mitochondrial [Scaptodrosophila lebanonensis]